MCTTKTKKTKQKREEGWGREGGGRWAHQRKHTWEVLVRCSLVRVTQSVGQRVPSREEPLRQRVLAHQPPHTHRPPPHPCPTPHPPAPSSSSSFLKIKRYISFAPMKWRLVFALWFKWFDSRLFKFISKYFLGLQKLRIYDWMHFTWNLWLLDSGNPCNSEARCGWV